MRHLLLTLSLLCALPAPAQAWTFSPLPICTMADTQDGLVIEVTFDPESEIYALNILRPGGWPDAPFLSLRFDQGPGNMMISTNRHVIEGERLTVTDSGFGNVLRGFADFGRATLSLGDQTITFDTTDAARAVTSFRACPSAISV